MTPARRLRRAAAAAALLTLAILAGWWLARRPPAPAPVPSLDPALVPPADAARASEAATEFEITRTHSGVPDFHLWAERVLGLEGGVYRLRAPRVELLQRDGGKIRAAGREGTFDADAEEGRLEGEARAEDDDGAVIESEAMLYVRSGEAFVAEGTARFSRAGIAGEGDGLRYDAAAGLLTVARRVRMRGEEVPGEGGGGPWRLEADGLTHRTASGETEAGAFTLIADAGTLRGDHLRLQLAPGGSRIVRAEASGRAILEERPPPGPAALPVPSLGGERIVMIPGEAPDRRPLSIEASGSAVLLAAGAGAGVRDVRGDRILLERTAGEGAEEARLLTATGVVSARLEDRRGEVGLLEAERLRASVGADGRVQSGEAEGKVTYRGSEGTASAAALKFDGGGERLILLGTPGVPPTIEGKETRVSGERLELDRDSGMLRAEAGVRTVTTSGRGAGGLFDARLPIHATADRLAASREPDRAEYEGGVRLWQGESFLQGDRVRLERGAGELEAEGRVATRTATRDAAAAGGVAWVEGHAPRFVYHDAQRTAIYDGGAEVVRGAQRISGTRIEVSLDERDQLREVLAQGGVVLEQPGWRGTGEQVSYRPLDGVAVLRGGDRLAEAQDTVNQRVVRGPTLTFELAGSRMNLQSGPGGRTWITLTPSADPAPPRQQGDRGDGGERNPS